MDAEYLCLMCAHCLSHKNDCCRCEYEGPIEMKLIEPGWSARIVCEDFDWEEDYDNA